MSYAAHHKDFGSFATHKAPAETDPIARKVGILRRIFDAFMDTRQRDVDRQVARFLASRSAGNLTDGLEREISQRLQTSNWSANGGPFSNGRFL